MFYLDRGSCRCQTLPKILGYSLMTYSEPRSFCSFCSISAFLRLIRLSFSPTLPSDLHYYLPALFFACRGHLVAAAGSELTLSHLVVLTDWIPSLSTPSACRSLSMPFRSGLSPSPCSINHAYLPGLLAARPSAFCGRWRNRTAAHSQCY